jgi:O-antigen biosynthesis protein
MFSVVIPSARADNLVACVQALIEHDPGIAPDRIVVVDDGARGEAEAQLPAVRWVEGAKPFVFARNVNLGIAAAGRDDVIVLNDDAELASARGLSRMALIASAHALVGVCSAAIEGTVNNPAQRPVPDARWLRYDLSSLAFVCVWISRRTWELVGPFDERFIGYGCEDDDYCRRVRSAGLRLAILDRCVVRHVGVSTWRTRADWQAEFAVNRRLFADKWGAPP